MLSKYLTFLKVRFINFERTKLPEEILKHNLEEKRKYFSDICLEVETSDAELQVYIYQLSPFFIFYFYFVRKMEFLCLYGFALVNYYVVS